MQMAVTLLLVRNNKSHTFRKINFNQHVINLLFMLEALASQDAHCIIKLCNHSILPHQVH
jgi:hypothetical protein